MASKYERRVDTRSYDDKKKLFEGVSKEYVAYDNSTDIKTHKTEYDDKLYAE